MSRIFIKSFGPIKEGHESQGGFLEIKTCTVFIGNNGTGKSTIAKLISTFSWLEKALVRGDFTIGEASRKGKFEKTYCGYQGLRNFFVSSTHLEYDGDAYHFRFQTGRLHITEQPSISQYEMPKIMYVPAERNFVSSVETPEKLKYLPSNLYEFLDEYIMNREEHTEPIQTPLPGIRFQFNKQKGARILGQGYSINLFEASSGIQSAIPLFIVTRGLANSIGRESDASKRKNSVKEEQRRRQRLERLLKSPIAEEDFLKEIELLRKGTVEQRFENIVEEIEQNLFPSSQKAMLYSLLSFANQNIKNNLVLTTHSPYIINFLSIAIQAGDLLIKLADANRLSDFEERLKAILPLKAFMSPDSVAIYEVAENGTINQLRSFEGIPSDKNYLNQSLAEGNKMFDALLEIEQEL